MVGTNVPEKTVSGSGRGYPIEGIGGGKIGGL